MYLTYSGKNHDCVTAINSFRDSLGKKRYGITYIGKCIKDDIFFCKNDGYFRFDVKTTEFFDAPEGFCAPQKVNEKRRINTVLNFGDTYLINELLYKSGYIGILQETFQDDFDTLMVLVLSYIVTSEPNSDIEIWYENNIIKYLYPNANVKSQRISEFLTKIGDANREILFHKLYTKYIFERCQIDKNVLIDSTGLKNDICFYYTTFSNHNGKQQNELRLVFVSNSSTGIPLFYKFIPGNVLDINTLRPIIAQLNELGITISSCILDAGYNSSENLDSFYDNNGNVKIEYITRLKSNDKNFKEAISKYSNEIRSNQNIVKYGDRVLYIIEEDIKVGVQKDKDAFMYMCLDIKRQGDENEKNINKSNDNDVSLDEIHDKLAKSGFFALICNNKYSINDIISKYYERQSIEQTFDFSKNYTKLLPLRVHNEDTLRGHLLISYIAICILKIIQIQLQSTNSYLSRKLKHLAYQHCTVYTNTIVVEYPQKEANNLYKSLEIKTPDKINIENDKIKIEHYKQDSLPTWAKNIKNNKVLNCIKNTNNDSSINNIDPKFDNKDVEQNNILDNDAVKSNNVDVEQINATNQNLKEESAEKKGRGRPKGRKNRKTLEREAESITTGQTPSPEKRGRGRPKKTEQEHSKKSDNIAPDTPKKLRGRPPGRKNRKTLEREAAMISAGLMPSTGECCKKRGRGRPKKELNSASGLKADAPSETP